MDRPDRAETAAISNIDVKTRARCIDDAEQCLGMNVGGIPFSQHRQGFLMVVISLSIVTGLLAYFVLLKRRD
jgi:hypothetical protein